MLVWMHQRERPTIPQRIKLAGRAGRIFTLHTSGLSKLHSGDKGRFCNTVFVLFCLKKHTHTLASETKLTGFWNPADDLSSSGNRALCNGTRSRRRVSYCSRLSRELGLPSRCSINTTHSHIIFKHLPFLNFLFKSWLMEENSNHQTVSIEILRAEVQKHPPPSENPLNFIWRS